MTKPRFLVALALLLLAAGCARLPAVTSIKAKSVGELQEYLFTHKADVDEFRLRGPFDVATHKDRELPLSASEHIPMDVYLSTPAQKAPLAIFLHGYDSSKEAHGYQALHVASWGMHCISVQLAEHGPWSVNGQTLARIVNFIHRSPASIDPRIDANRIVLVGHSFGGSSVIVALAQGSPAAGAVLLDAAGVGKELPQHLRQVKVPVMLLGADEGLSEARNREYFFDFLRSNAGEISIKDAVHEDAQFPLEQGQRLFGGREDSQIDFVSALTAAVFSLAATGRLDYAWQSYAGALGNGKFFNAKKK